MACGVAVAATASEPVRWMLGERSRHVAPIADVGGFARAALAALKEQRVDYGPLPSWDRDCALLDHWLRSPPKAQRLDFGAIE
jgi:hypothetical protein